MRIFVDAMGGDLAPQAPVEGTVEALHRNPELTVTLAGIVPEIEKYLAGADDVRSRITLLDAPEVITNHESPVMGVRKKTKSATVMGMLAVRDKEADGFVSAGSTGAVLAGGMFRLGRIPGVERPALAPLMPNGKGYFLLIDCGANVDCKPEYLTQFGVMGDAYMRGVMGIEKPRVGIINIGAEDEKGNALVKDAFPLMAEAPYHFVGSVEAVKPYFERFLKALPTVEDLAQAPEEQLLKLWEGLGYYNRVRNLQRGARAVMAEHGGVIPASFEALKKLPGIGDYTAGAIGSIAFQIPVPAVDGNVLRVISRVLYRRDNILDAKVKRRIEGEIKEILPERTGDFNQSLMELGATVCLPNGAPKCNECPLQELCRAHLVGDEESLPVKTKAKKRKIEQRTVFLLVCDGKIALRKRPEKGLLAGLWELPSQE